MSVRTIGFGIIGGGLMGREFASAAARWSHLTAASARPVIVAVCDTSPAVLEWFGSATPAARLLEDYQELLVDPAVEAVYVAVPHHLHEEIYGAVLRAGKHLMAEKPYGIDLAAAQRIEAERARHPALLVRCSGEFPFFPGALRIAQLVASGACGEILEWRSGFLHSSDLDPTKPINWKRRVATCGEYGCMGDLGLHVVHIPFRCGLFPRNVRALLSNVVKQRPGPTGALEPCDTWDNAVLACESTTGFPMIFETKRIAPGERNTWYLRVTGTRLSLEFSTRYPKSLRSMRYEPGSAQVWQEEDLGYESASPAITGPIFEFGFTDAILQMWAAYVEELCGKTPAFGCATPEEALMSHRLFTAALKSARDAQVMEV